MQLLDQDGLENVTIRALARVVGLPTMTLYGYFEDKRSLCDAMRERAFEEVFSTRLRATWREQLEDVARNVVAELRAHPRWVPLLSDRSGTPTPSTIAFFEHLVGLMGRDGFAPLEALRACSAVFAFAWGVASSESTFTGPRARTAHTTRVSRVKKRLAELPRSEVHGVLAGMEAIEAWSTDAVFELGLRALLRGIEPAKPAS